MEEESTKRSFRNRTRQEYEERKAEADLGMFIIALFLFCLVNLYVRTGTTNVCDS